MNDTNRKSKRYYSLKIVANFTDWFYILRREMNTGERDFRWAFVLDYFTEDRRGKKDFYFDGWSRQLDDGTKKVNAQYMVTIDVNTTDSLAGGKAQFFKIDAAKNKGGFCNDYTESGNVIMSRTDRIDFGVEYITVYDPDRPRSSNCSGKITAIKMPPWESTLVRLVREDEDRRKNEAVPWWSICCGKS